MENNKTILMSELQMKAEVLCNTLVSLEKDASDIARDSSITDKLNDIIKNYDIEESPHMVDLIAMEINARYDENPEAKIKDIQLLNKAHDISKQLLELIIDIDEIQQDEFSAIEVGEQLLRKVTDHINQK